MSIQYIGGYFDTEGHIHARKHPGSNGLISYARVEATDVEPLELMHAIVGGSLKFANRLTVTGKQVYRWIACGDDLNDFLRRVYPWLLLKKPQAAMMFKLRKTLNRAQDVPEPIIRSRAIYCEKIRAFHNSAEGPDGSQPPFWNEEDILKYAAGALDGDGHVRTRNKKYRYLSLDVTGKAPTIPQFFAHNFGGSIHCGRQYHWNLYNQKAEALYAKLQPYLLIKNDVRSVETAHATGEALCVS